MPVNPYDDRKVSLRRSHGNVDLDIVGALGKYNRGIRNKLRLQIDSFKLV